MKDLTQILPLSFITKIIGDENKQIQGIALDSRIVEPNFVFAAIKGTQVDGHKFINKAIDLGANTILCEHLPQNIREETTYIQCVDSALCLGHLASAFYGNPSKEMKVIGVTGTNGKTSVATILKNTFTHLGYKCGLISTVQNEIGAEIIEATHTTPNAVALQKLFSLMVEKGCDYVFMEASSHAIHQKRIAGVDFDGAIFTNISHDHLDYHGTFNHYIKAKKELFDQLKSSAFALTNIDDKNGRVMLQNTKARKKTYSLKSLADYKTKILEQDFTSMLLEVNSNEVYTPISGTFNAYNLTAAYGTLCEMGIDSTQALMALSQSKGAEGRLDWVKNHKNQVGIIDYAHTPDALENVLKALKQMNSTGGNIITVVGCGGNRDKDKRPKMAQIASELSERVILTSDNPRNEEPETILDEMEAGIPIHKKLNAITITDRRNAIKTACSLAQEGDLILVAGKGHEKYQEIKGIKYPFDDKAVLQEFLIAKTT
ncbi:MAG: UDP-N-acetylmuramoyl-L-alanyl-D-glutamate--2,6-diaminopimelate ligase [Bacteroidia bacterium]